MANLRPMLFMGLIVLSYLMWVEWQKDYGPQSIAPTSNTTPTFEPSAIPGSQDNSIPSGADLPDPGAGNTSTNQGDIPTSASSQTVVQQAAMSGARELLTVTTDVLEVSIDLTGGTLVSAKLLDYPVELEIPDIKVDLFSQDGPGLFIAQSGLLSQAAAPNHTSTYQSASMS